MVCGLPPPSSTRWRVALRSPGFVGAKTSDSWQVAPAPICEPQVLVSEKSGPVMLMSVKFKAVLPVFVRVTDMGALLVPTLVFGNVTCCVDNCTTVPFPDSSMTWGLEEALSETSRSPLFGPFDWGRKRALMAQLPPGATVAPQVVAPLN